MFHFVKNYRFFDSFQKLNKKVVDDVSKYFSMEICNLFCITTGCPKEKLAFGNKLFMASGGLFWIYLEFYWPEPLQVHCWVTPECTS